MRVELSLYWRRMSACLLAAAVAVACAGGASAEPPKHPKGKEAAAKSAKKVLKPKPAVASTAPGRPMVLAPSAILPPADIPTARPMLATATPEPAAPLASTESASTSASDIALVKRALDLLRSDDTSGAVAVQKTIEDPLARKLVEWAILRSDDHEANFDRFAAFVAANPSWPGITLLRKRAENTLWDEKRDPATVRAFFASAKPTMPKGRFALARALLAQGDRVAATYYVREAWRNDVFSQDLEKQAEETFGDLLTSADHKARMEALLYAEETDAAMRFAKRLGAAELAIAKAREAVIDKSPKAGRLLDAVPASVRHDAGYIFGRVQWLRRQEKWAEAAQLLAAAPRDPAALVDPDQWWNERRMVARGLLDSGDPAGAYQVARDTVPPRKGMLRVEQEFLAGWIALRFNDNPGLAYQHFQRAGHDTVHPNALARSEYWQGRAAEAAGRTSEARGHYQAAARYPTAFYGQIARAKLGITELSLRRPPEPSNRAALMRLEVVRAIQILYAVDARDLVLPFASDLADHAVDPGALTLIAEIAAKNDDARAMLHIGKAALARGLSFDVYAFPTNGLPEYQVVGPPVDPSVVYSITRTESAFNPRAVSPAKALGLMQVMPATAKMVAKKFGLAFNAKRLLSDPAYNAQIGTAELGDRLQDYRGSYILTFCAYNAGPGRVKQWLAKYGDPRDAETDPIDWVERIPITETRNYVQRVIENMQIYRAQLSRGSQLMIEADLRRGSAN